VESLGLRSAVALLLSAYPFRTAFAATGPYTLPFWANHSVTQPYWCTGFTSELPFGPGSNADGTHYDYSAHFHNIDYGISYLPVVASSAGTGIFMYDGYAEPDGRLPTALHPW
jgi:hypothetical protein